MNIHNSKIAFVLFCLSAMAVSAAGFMVGAGVTVLTLKGLIYVACGAYNGAIAMGGGIKKTVESLFPLKEEKIEGADNVNEDLCEVIKTTGDCFEIKEISCGA